MRQKNSELICDHEMGAEPVDEPTKKAIEEAQASVRCGEAISLEQSDANLRRRLEEWRKRCEKPLTAS